MAEKIKIVQPNPESNLCMFYAIYNELISNRLKQAFCCNNIEEPANKFLECTRRWKSIEQIEQEG